MSDTNFTDGVTKICAEWLNAVNDFVYGLINADKIKGVDVDNADMGNGKSLVYNSTSGNLEYETSSGDMLVAAYDPASIIEQLVGLTATQTLTNKTLILARIAGSTYSTLQHLQNTFHSSGWVSGGVITDAGSGNITVAVGTGYIRATDSSVVQLLFMDWSALGSTAIPSDTTRYIGVEYNAGSPAIIIKTTDIWDKHTDFPLGLAVNEGGTLFIENSPHGVGDHAAGMIERSHRVMGIQRDKESGGIMLSETGTRNIVVSAGALWDRLTSFVIAALDTSITGTFDAYYSDGGSGFTKDAGRTDWNNTQYDDGSGTLATLAANKYSVQWFYVSLTGDVIMIYGETHNSASDAEEETAPVAKPDRIAHLSILIGRIVFKKSDATALEIQSAFTQSFNAGLASDHGNLTGLADNDHPQYQLLDADTAKLDVNQSWTGSQRATLVVDNDGSFDMDAGNNFKCTPSGTITIEFTNETNGQSGYIWLINTGGHTINWGAEVDVPGGGLILGTGTHLLAYICDGTNVIISAAETVS